MPQILPQPTSNLTHATVHTNFTLHLTTPPDFKPYTIVQHSKWQLTRQGSKVKRVVSIAETLLLMGYQTVEAYFSVGHMMIVLHID